MSEPTGDEVTIHDPEKFTWHPGDMQWDDEETSQPNSTGPRDHRGAFTDHGKRRATQLGEEAT